MNSVSTVRVSNALLMCLCPIPSDKPVNQADLAFVAFSTQLCLHAGDEQNAVTDSGVFLLRAGGVPGAEMDPWLSESVLHRTRGNRTYGLTLSRFNRLSAATHTGSLEAALVIPGIHGLAISVNAMGVYTITLDESRSLFERKLGDAVWQTVTLPGQTDILHVGGNGCLPPETIAIATQPDDGGLPWPPK